MVINVLDLCSLYAVNNVERIRHKNKLVHLVAGLINFLPSLFFMVIVLLYWC